jgi:hypothetical protein
MAGKRKGHAGHRAVAFLEHAGKRLLGHEVLGAIRERAVHHIRPKHMVAAKPASFAKGGKVMKTGHAKVHAGEVVLTKKTVGHLKKLLK